MSNYLSEYFVLIGFGIVFGLIFAWNARQTLKYSREVRTLKMSAMRKIFYHLMYSLWHCWCIFLGFFGTLLFWLWINPGFAKNLVFYLSTPPYNHEFLQITGLIIGFYFAISLAVAFLSQPQKARQINP